VLFEHKYEQHLHLLLLLLSSKNCYPNFSQLYLYSLGHYIPKIYDSFSPATYKDHVPHMHIIDRHTARKLKERIEHTRSVDIT